MRLLRGFGILLLNAVISQSALAYDFSYQADYERPTHQMQRDRDAWQYENRGYDLLSKSAYLFVYQAAVIYGLTLCPEDWTQWKPEYVKPKHWWRNFKNNAYSKPVVDHDPFWVNYIGHPISGYGYYVMARQTGYDQLQSFLYTVFESTVVWENGVEAMVEEPSVQDLIITPIIGSLWGELNYRLIQNIESNGGKVYGSQTLGNIALIALSPFNAGVVWTRDQLRGGYYYTPVMHSSMAIVPGRHHGQEMVLSWSMQF